MLSAKVPFCLVNRSSNKKSKAMNEIHSFIALLFLFIKPAFIIRKIDGQAWMKTQFHFL